MQKYSQLFGKTQKKSKDYDAINATMLIKAGYIYQESAGVYNLLPLGLKVFRKIEQVIREEMDKVSQEVQLPLLQPSSSWEQTGRRNTVDILLQAIGANKSSLAQNAQEYILASTAEEIVTPLGKSFNWSYRDLPFSLYQIHTKFRNEARPKSGLLRGREFVMKDAYSFHESEADLLEYYEQMKHVYTRIYERLGIGDNTVIALASGGDFTNEYSHEFQTIVPTGEDTLFRDPDSGVVYNKEVAPARVAETDEVEANAQEELLPRKDVKGEGIIGVDQLAEFLEIPVEKTTKTILFETIVDAKKPGDEKRVIAAAIRGDYEINEEKFAKVIGTRDYQLASESTVRKFTGAEIGYAGLLDLPESVEIYMDDSMAGRRNFEMGANKTDYHSINVNFERDIDTPEKFYDFKTAKHGDLCPKSGAVYEVLTAAEVGNIFPLNTKFSDAFDYDFTTSDGKTSRVYMGCYGIGLQRTMGVIAELTADETGLAWPVQVAPYQVHFITLREDYNIQSEEVIRELEHAGFDVLWDERQKISIGEKFADADLLGMPVRIVLGPKSDKQGGVEVKLRKAGNIEIVAPEKLVEYLQDIL